MLPKQSFLALIEGGKDMNCVSSAIAVEEHIKPWALDQGLVLHHNPVTGSGAVLTECGNYRVLLWRRTHQQLPFLGMGMLNPATADHEENDNTIKRCLSRATAMGLAGPLVWNLFDFRTKDPDEMKLSPSPISSHNDSAIELALQLSSFSIAAWGNDGQHLNRQTEVLKKCASVGATLHYLKMTGAGCPWHPLYVAEAVQPQKWEYAL